MYIPKIALLLFLFLPGFILGVPPLKWVRSVKEIEIRPRDLFDYSKDAVLCTDFNQIVLLRKKDGTVIRKVTDIKGILSETLDSGFAAAANGNCIILINHALEKVWSKTITDSTVKLVSVSQTRDSGFIALGNNETDINVHVIKTDKNGDTLWTRICSKPNADLLGYEGVGVCEVEDGYIVCRSYCLIPCKWQNALFTKYSMSGGEQWSGKFYGFTVTDMISMNGNSALFIGEHDDNAEPDLGGPEYPVLGKRQYFFPTSVYYLHLGANGKVINNRSLEEGSAKSWGNSIKLNNGNSIVAGFVSSPTPIMPPMNEVQIFEVTDEGTSKTIVEYSIPGSSTANPIALPFLSGELLVYTKDSLYYYEKPTKIQTNPVESHSGHIKQISFISENKTINYSLTCPLKLKIDLLSFDGRFIRSVDQGIKNAGSHTLPTTGLSSGIYFLRFQHNDLRDVYRILIP